MRSVIASSQAPSAENCRVYRASSPSTQSTMMLSCNKTAPVNIVQKVPRLNAYADNKPIAKEIIVTWFGVILRRTAAQVNSLENLRNTNTEKKPSFARLAIFKRNRAMFKLLISS